MDTAPITTHTIKPDVATAAQASVSMPVKRWQGDSSRSDTDTLAVEEPLQIRMAGEDVAVTMRTPGHDQELAVGFLFSEGLIAGKRHIASIAHCLDERGSPAANIVNLQPTERDLVDPRRWGRNFVSSSSCGLCGKTSIEQIGRRLEPLSARFQVSASILYSLPDKLRAEQEAFSQTGGIHAAGLFTLSGDLLALREDVGRHNAVDKIIGYALLNDMLPLSNHILLVSSRASFEIVQKAWAAGISLLAVISAPSSLAVETAQEAEMTLVAFLRGERLNVYAGEWRVSK